MHTDMNVETAPPAPAAPRLAGVEPEVFARHNGARYRAPADLQVTPTPAARFLVVGGCLAQPFPEIAALVDPRMQGDFLLVNNFDAFPELPEDQVAQYEFQILHIPLRTILGQAFFRLPDDGSRHEEFLRQTQEYLARYLANALKLNRERKLLTFVLGFLVPQQNPLGRFQPRYDLRNIMHFIERLNMFLAAEVARNQNAHWVDLDQLAASIGKKSCQDDMVWSFTHGTTLSDGDHDHDLNRVQPPVSMQHHYVARWGEFYEAVMHEIFAMYRTTLQLDAVKLVAVDLDDTLWRGVAAEGTLGVAEGWPMGMLETLLYLKKRGILLAIVSKNDGQFIEANWDRIVGGPLKLEDFAVRKINFQSKAQNLADLLREVNLRPENALMVDDHPAEREAIRRQLPGVRVLGRRLYYLKRVLLWAPETQTPALTAEAGQKTAMVQAQLRRDTVRQTLSHEEFLRTLGLRVSLSRIRDLRDVNLNRALELFNKTNQFNTTGARYTLQHFHQFLAAGRQLHVIEAEDRFTQYGLIGAAWVERECVVHWVMSCRALGLGIEEAFLGGLARQLAAAGGAAISGQLVATAANLACRQIFSRNGFAPMADRPGYWSRPLAAPPPVPAHLALTMPPLPPPRESCA
jgi:FkbH-like protein